MHDEQQRKSLAYRKNEAAIWSAHVPPKYTRLLPFIAGQKVIEVGAAEGVLSLTLACEGHDVVAVELRNQRHVEALKLQAQWAALGKDVSKCKMVNADIREAPWLFESMDTAVFVRSVYYLRDQAQEIVNAAAKCVGEIVMCGNGNRAAAYALDRSDTFNKLASLEGMSELITNAGFEIVKTVAEGDPIVVGRRKA
jgi:hypothetical protein